MRRTPIFDELVAERGDPLPPAPPPIPGSDPEHPLHPQVHVDMTRLDGNAFAIIGGVARAIYVVLGRVGADAWYEDAFQTKDYDALLRLALCRVNTLEDRFGESVYPWSN